jgi:hypothetical protein
MRSQQPATGPYRAPVESSLYPYTCSFKNNFNIIIQSTPRFPKCSLPFRFSDKNFVYEGVSKNFRTESITKYMLTFGITHWGATQRVMAAKLTRLTHEIAIQLHLVAEGCTICSSRSRRPVRKLLDTPSYISLLSVGRGVEMPKGSLSIYV